MVGERGTHSLDAGTNGLDLGGQRIDALKHHLGEEAVVVLEVTGQRLFQHSDLGAHGAAGHRSQDLGITLAGDQCAEHLSPGHTEDVADHRRQLDLRSSNSFSHRCLSRVRSRINDRR